MPQTTLHKQNLKLHKNQLFFSGSAVGFRPSAGRHFQNKYKYLFCSVPTAVIFTTLLGLFTLNFLQVFTPDNSYAETHTDNASGAYNGTTYSLSTTVSDLNLELKNVTPAGKAVYGKQTVNVTTNAPGGYQLYMQTSGNLAGTKEGTATSDSIAALSSNNAALDINTWGYTKTTPNEDANTAAEQTIWNTPPSTLTQIDSTSSAATSGRDTDIYYGIKADNTLSGDNYSGTITYTTIANDAASDTLLSVSPTSGAAGQATKITITTSLMTTSTGVSASDITAKVGSYTCSSVSITSTTPLKFTCNTSTSLTAGTYTVTATISKYNKTYTKSSAYTAITPGITNNATMQSITREMCKNTPLYSASGTTYTLKDSRDNSTYSVRKLADSNCWMVQNLKLTGARTLTSSDSNVSSNFSLTASDTSTWCTSNSSSCDDKSMLISTSYGTLYNWYAATAGTGKYSTSSGTVSSSVCPKSGSGSTSADSWHLPSGNTSGEWYNLFNAYKDAYGYSNIRGSGNSTTNNLSITIGPNFVYSGSRNGANTSGQSASASTSAHGYWWSRTANGNNTALGAGVDGDGGVYGGTGIGISKYNGNAVRCVLSST